LRYELRWMNRFGLNYYGCCDVLHRKMAIMEKIPNLRKVSMSPFINPDEAVANVGNRYVFSYKPNPAVLAEDTWHLDKAEHELENVLSKAKAHGCVVEVIMKDISTVRYQPQRLWNGRGWRPRLPSGTADKPSASNAYEAVRVEDEFLRRPFVEVPVPRAASSRVITSTLTALAICTLSCRMAIMSWRW